MNDKVMAMMKFAKIHPLKNYFIDSLPYQENNKVVKKTLPDDIDSGNEATPNQEKTRRLLLIKNQLSHILMILIVIIHQK